MYLDSSLGEKIKRQREARNLTQRELARLLGITPAAVCQWERKGIVPRAKTLAKVAHALGISQSTFSEDSSPPIENLPALVSAHIEQLKTKIAAATGLEKDRINIHIKIAD